VRALGADRFEARGQLSIKGMTRDVIAPFTVKRTGESTVYEGGFSLSRLQFSIGEGIWSDTETVADEVQVRFRIVQARDAQ
jgi:polyisoprenoid-binding protein YceI